MNVVTNTQTVTANRSQALNTGSTKDYRGYSRQKQDDNAIFRRLHELRETRKKTREAEKQPRQAGVEQLQAAINGDKTALNMVLSELSPTIDAALASIVGNDPSYKTRARIIAANALKDFQPDRGTSLSTFIYNRLQGLRRLSANRGNFIHVPERSALEKRQLEEIKRDYVLENGIEPSLAELADRSGMPLRKVGRLMSITGSTSTSATRGEHGDSLESAPRTATELYTDAFYTELPEVDKKIYEWSTGYGGSPMLDRATMAKKLKMSEAAISQHAHKIDRRAAAFNQTVNRTIYGDTYSGGLD